MQHQLCALSVQNFTLSHIKEVALKQNLDL